jgi:hypothetical protein
MAEPTYHPLVSDHYPETPWEYRTLFEVSKSERAMFKQQWRAKPYFSSCRFCNLGDIQLSDAHHTCLMTR